MFQAAYILPSNFEDVATGVLKVLNNLAFLDLKFMQRVLVSWHFFKWNFVYDNFQSLELSSNVDC